MGPPQGPQGPPGPGGPRGDWNRPPGMAPHQMAPPGSGFPPHQQGPPMQGPPPGQGKFFCKLFNLFLVLQKIMLSLMQNFLLFLKVQYLI